MTLYDSEKLFPLLDRINSKHKDEFYCLNWPHSFRAENKLKSYEKVFKNKDFCEIILSSQNNDTLELNQ